MARPSEEQLGRLADEVAVSRLVEGAGIELEHAGSGLIGPCRLCGTSAGFTVDPAGNVWACSGCGRSGGPVEWVMATEGVSLALAVEMLREGMPLSSGPVGSVPKRASTSKLPPLEAGLADDVLLGEVIGFYQRTLGEAPEAVEFLARRGLADAELVETFGLGFANRTLSYRIPNRQRTAGRVLRAQLQGLGVLAASGHEAMSGSLVVPVTDPAGRIVQAYGRKVNTHLSARSPLHTWLAGPVPLFNAATLAHDREVVLVGSVLDALSLWSAGFRHVVAVAGPDGFDRTHLDTLTTAGVERVLVGFRRDSTGERAASTVAKALLGARVECFRVEWPSGMDANDYALASANRTDAFGRAIRTAAWMGRGPVPARRRPTPPAPVPEPAVVAEPVAVPEPVVAVEPTDVDQLEAGEHQAEHAEVEDLAEHAEVGDLADEGEVGPVVSPVPSALESAAGSWDGEALRLVFAERHWRIRNLERCTSFDSLRVNVCVSVPGGGRGPGFHVDVFDLYSARARASFVRDAAGEIGIDAKVLKDDLARVNRPGFVGGSRPCKRGWSYAEREEFREADDASVQR